MKSIRAARRVRVTGDGRGVASHAGALLVAEVADRVGLTAGLSVAMAHTRQRRSAHDPGVVLAHLAVSLVDGGDCLSDIAVLRDQPDLFGAVASDPTVFRVLDSIHSEGLRNIATARAAARAAVWAAGATPEEIVIDLDGTLLDAYSEKQDAAATYKHGFGFYPIVAFLDESGEALAGLLRPGNAGSNNAADHLTTLDRSLAQLPVTPDEIEMLVRTDSAGATHDFVDGCRDRNVAFSVGLPVDQRVRASLLLAQEEDWIPAIETDGSVRDGAWVIELTELIDVANWPEHTRVIARRERPHPGAQLSLFDQHEGFRHQIFITDQPEPNIAALELRHRHRAHVENRIRAAKDTGLRNLPCADVVCNDAWLQLVLIAQDLIAWSQVLCFDGALNIAEPKRLRHRVFHAAAAVVHSGGQVIVRFQRTWPWVDDIVTAFTRLRVAFPS
ncbi:MAG TPA: IS1380 family transposase [Acidimicrobiia bacterium]